MSLLIKGGRVLDPSSGIDGLFDVLVEKGKISAVEKDLSRKETAKTIDAKGRLVVPGLIDVHTHLREPGYEYKETIKTGTAAAAAGGFTSIACMPNTLPVNDNQAVTDFIVTQAKKEGIVNVYPIGAISLGLEGEDMVEIGDLKESGIVAVSDDGKAVMNSELMRRVLEYTKMFNLPVIAHSEDKDLVGNGVVIEGYYSTLLGLKGIPAAAEEVMVARDIALAELTGGRLHVAHTSTKGSLRHIREAKKRGINVTCEVTPHHFILTDEYLQDFDTNYKVNPPLGTEEDRAAVIEAVKDGTADIIASDHAPHDTTSKEVEFDQAAFGMIGLETTLPLTLKLVHEKTISLNDAIVRLSVNPSRLLGLDRGSLAIGKDADITIIDFKKEHTVDVKRFKSKSKNSPFHGWKLKGIAEMTIVEGRVVFDRSKEG